MRLFSKDNEITVTRKDVSHSHDSGWVLGYEGDEDSPAMERHERRYGHAGDICRHHGRLRTREYCETCGRSI